MSQRNRIVFAAVALAAALLLAAPSPSRAAGLWEDRLPGMEALEQLWSWVSSLLPDGGFSRATPWEKEGSVVDPMGQQPHTATTPPTTPAQEDPGQ